MIFNGFILIIFLYFFRFRDVILCFVLRLIEENGGFYSINFFCHTFFWESDHTHNVVMFVDEFLYFLLKTMFYWVWLCFHVC
jgi:hypothetical protein